MPGGRGRSWTEAEDDVVRAAYPEGGISGVRAALLDGGFGDRTDAAVAARASRLGVWVRVKVNGRVMTGPSRTNPTADQHLERTRRRIRAQVVANMANELRGLDRAIAECEAEIGRMRERRALIADEMRRRARVAG